MNRTQWFIVGVGLMIIGLLLEFWLYPNHCSIFTTVESKIFCWGEQFYIELISLIMCMIGIIFIICGFYEKMEKEVIK